MPTESGFSNQKKLGLSQYKTIHNVGSDKFAENVVTKGLIERQTTSIAITGVDYDESTRVLTLDVIGHGSLRDGEVLRFYTGPWADVEADIIEVLSDDLLKIYNVIGELPEVGDEVRTAYYRTPQFDLNGNIVVSSGPTQFIYDGVSTEVEQNTTFPPDNRPLPSGMFILKEGISYPVSDSATPSEVVAVPVKIMAVDGTNINITAGDINVQLTDIGPTFDSVRIGDGSGNYIGVNAATEALVHDADVVSELATLNLVDFSTEAKQDNIITELQILKQPITLGAAISTGNMIRVGGWDGVNDRVLLTDTTGRLTVTGTMALPTGAATEAKQDTIITEIQNGNSELVDLNAKDFATETTLGGVKTANDSMVVSLGDVTDVAVSDPTLPASLISAVKGVNTNLLDISDQLPTTLGATVSADSLSVTLATDQAAISTTQTAMVASFQEILNLTTVAQTFTAPANAKWCKIYADDTNVANIRVKMGGAASNSSGIQFQPGRSEDYMAVGNISVIAESGANQKICVQFGV